MSKIAVIGKAWLEVLKGMTTEEHKRRAKICGECTFAKYNAYLDFIDDELKQVKGMVCNDCGCPLVSKIRSTDKCPQGKW